MVGGLGPGMRGCGAVVVLGLVSAHWLAGPRPRVSGCRALEVPELVFLAEGTGPGPSGAQGWVLGQLWTQGALRQLA